MDIEVLLGVGRLLAGGVGGRDVVGQQVEILLLVTAGLVRRHVHTHTEPHTLEGTDRIMRNMQPDLQTNKSSHRNT